MKKTLFSLLLSTAIVSNSLFAMDPLPEEEKKSFSFSPNMLVIQEKKVRGSQTLHLRFKGEGCEKSIKIKLHESIKIIADPIKIINLIPTKTGSEIHFLDPLEAHDRSYYVIKDQSEVITSNCYNVKGLSEINLNPGRLYAHSFKTSEPSHLVNYSDFSIQQCPSATSRKDWRGRSYAYEKNNNFVVYENEKVLYTHILGKKGELGDLYFSDHGNLYLYLLFAHELHKIDKDGKPVSLSEGVFDRPSGVQMPQMLYFTKDLTKKTSQIQILNQDEKVVEIKDHNLNSINGAISTPLPKSAVYIWGPDKTTGSDAIVKINPDGSTVLPNTYGLKKIALVRAGSMGTIYIQGTLDRQDVVMEVSNTGSQRIHTARPEFKIVHIESVQGYSRIPLIIKEHTPLIDDAAHTLDMKKFTQLYKTLWPIEPVYTDGEAIYDAFASIIADPKLWAQNSVRLPLFKLINKYERTEISGYAHALKFEALGGIGAIYKWNELTTKENLVEEASIDESDKFSRTLIAQEKLALIVKSTSGELRDTYNKNLQSVNKAMEVLLNNP